MKSENTALAYLQVSIMNHRSFDTAGRTVISLGHSRLYWTLSIIMPRTIISFKTFLKSDDYFHAHLRCIFTVLDLYPFDVD